jgi:hypothetical protein
MHERGSRGVCMRRESDCLSRTPVFHFTATMAVTQLAQANGLLIKLDVTGIASHKEPDE